MEGTGDIPVADDFEPGELVRVFSLSIKSKYEGNTDTASEIENALIEDLDVKERRRRQRIRDIEQYLESTMSHELIELNRAKQSLELAVREFCSSVQKNSSDDLSPKLESWQDVIVIVEKMRDRLERKQEKGKFRRVTRRLRTFCNTVKAHSTPLQMLPTSNQYVSIFYGALATALQASESYTKVMESLPEALIDINDAVSSIEKRLWLFENDTMKSYAWRMYTQIFSFLGNIIRWYTKRSYQRLMSSFNEHLPEFFEDQVDEIRKSADLIHQEAHLRTQADAQMSRLYLESVDGKFDKLISELRERDQRNRMITEQRYEQFREMMDEMQRQKLRDGPALQDVLHEIWTKMVRRETGDAMSQILECDAREQNALRSDDPEHLRSRIEQGGKIPKRLPPSIDQSMIGFTKSETCDTTRDMMLSFSAGLESFFNRTHVQPDFESSDFLIEPTTITCVQEWASAVESKIVYIAGEDSLSEDISISGIATHYSHLARETGLPVCSYFCCLQCEDPPKGRTRETMELVGLTYSLIRQLVELLPSKITWDNFHLDQDIFSALDGTLTTFPKALEILDTLLNSTGHSILILVIDSIDQLDDFTYRSSEKCLKQFVEVLLKHAALQEGKVLKILFTSTGKSTALFELLDSQDILISNSVGRRGQISGGEAFTL